MIKVSNFTISMNDAIKTDSNGNVVSYDKNFNAKSTLSLISAVKF
jgi:hypothetical protein